MGAVRDQPVLAWVPSRQNRSQLWNRGTVLGGMLCILAATVVISSREYSKTQENSLSWSPFGMNYSFQFKSLAKSLFDAAFDSCDSDGSGFIEFDELLAMTPQIMLVEGLEMMQTETAGLPRDQASAAWERMQKDLIVKIENTEYRQIRCQEIMAYLDRSGKGKLTKKDLQRAFDPEFRAECANPGELEETEFCELLERYINVLKALGLLNWAKVENVKSVPYRDAKTAIKTTKVIIKLVEGKIK
ncbi:hypothetical protein AAMO2058_001323300 [Amorphochlora amoebiformis]